MMVPLKKLKNNKNESRFQMYSRFFDIQIKETCLSVLFKNLLKISDICLSRRRPGIKKRRRLDYIFAKAGC